MIRSGSGRSWPKSRNQRTDRSTGDVVAATIDGLIATGLVRDRGEIHHTWHRRLERGYPMPSLHRDRALDRLQSAFTARDVLSRGPLWCVEIRSLEPGSQLRARRRGGGSLAAVAATEETLNAPEVVNARRPPAPGRVARP